MKKFKRFVNAGMAVWAFAAVIALAGCGKKESEDSRSDWEDLMEDAQETFGETDESDTADGYEDETDADYGAEGDMKGWRGDSYRLEVDGENGEALNGKMTSILLADDSFVYATTSEGGLFMLRPKIYFGPEDSEIKSDRITDGCDMDQLVYADQHTAYGNNRFVYFDRMEGYDEEALEGKYMLESLSDMPDIVYTFENMQKAELPDDQNLLFITQDAALYVYEDTNHQVRAGYKDSYSEEYTMSDEVAFEGDTERSGVTVEKSIFRFLLTKDQELLYIKKGNIASDLADNVGGISVSYVDFTDEIDGKVKDIYNLQNYTECCYAVDEEQNIYYVSADGFEDSAVEKITQFEKGTITDILGFSGKKEEMLIRTQEGAYYFYDGYDYISTGNVDAMNENCKSAVLLMEGDILALGDDGYLYVVENKN